MAIALSGTNQGMTRLTSLFDYNAAYTATGWFYKTASANDVIISFHNGSSDIDEISADAAELWAIRARAGGSGARQDDAFSISLNTWYFFAVVRSSVTDVTARLFSLSGSEVSSPTATQDVTGRTAQDEINLGHRDLSFDFTGRIHCIKIWTAALTTAELQRELRRIRPVRFANFNSWTPTINAATATRDIFAGLNWTLDGTPTDAPGPPISWGMGQSQIGVPAAAPPSGISIPVVYHHRQRI